MNFTFSMLFIKYALKGSYMHSISCLLFHLSMHIISFKYIVTEVCMSQRPQKKNYRKNFRLLTCIGLYSVNLSNKPVIELKIFLEKHIVLIRTLIFWFSLIVCKLSLPVTLLHFYKFHLFIFICLFHLGG